MTNSDSFEPDSPEDYDPMAMSRDYHDAPYVIPGIRIRRVHPSTRRHPRRSGDHGTGTTDPSTTDRDISKPLKSVLIGAGFAGVVRQNSAFTGVVRQKNAPSDGSMAPSDDLQKVEHPPEGAEMPLEGVGEPQCPDTRTQPLRRFSNGDQTPFRRSGDADPGAGGA